MTQEQLDLLTQKVNELEQRLDFELTGLKQQVETNSEFITGLNRAVQNLVEVTRAELNLTRELRANAEADRQSIREIQLECQRIWEYLLAQRGNGNRPN